MTNREKLKTPSYNGLDKTQMTWKQNKWEQGFYYNKQIRRMISEGISLKAAEDFAWERQNWFYYPTNKPLRKKGIIKNE